MYYKSILQSYHPVESGDFMRRYIINGRQYIIYSPESKYVSCLDLYSFRDIAPVQLALCIGSELSLKEAEDEFVLAKVCSRNDLINFLFDIEPKGGELFVGRRSGLQGYLLNDIQRPFKVRNFFQFHPETKESSLLFENELCCKHIVSKTNVIHIDICWDVYSFYLLEVRENEKDLYLLPSSNSVLLSFVYGQIMKDKKMLSDTSEMEIELHVRNTTIDALRFISMYLKVNNSSRYFDIIQENGNIVVRFDNWNPINIMNFVSKLQRICNLVVRESSSIEENLPIFQIFSHCSISYVVFPKVELYAKEFLKMIMKELKLDRILCTFN